MTQDPPIPTGETFLINTILEDFEKTYVDYLSWQRLDDSPVTKLGFYHWAIEYVEEFPLPDALAQMDLKKGLRIEMYDQLRKMRGNAEQTFDMIVKERGGKARYLMGSI